MKTNILKLTAILLVSAGCFSSCSKKGDNLSQNAYYVVGGSGAYILDETWNAIDYLLVSENLKDTIATFDLPDDLFTFPAEIMGTNFCGFAFFPDEYRFRYKVQMTGKLFTEEEEQNAYAICNALWHVPYPYLMPRHIFITSISKISGKL